MSQFMFLLRGGTPMEEFSPEEMEVHMGKWKAWMGGLAEQGKLAGGLPLNKTGKLVSSGGSSVADWSFKDGVHPVGGYIIVNAENIDEAVELSKACPIFEGTGGNVEVREMMEMG